MAREEWKDSEPPRRIALNLLRGSSGRPWQRARGSIAALVVLTLLATRAVRADDAGRDAAERAPDSGTVLSAVLAQCPLAAAWLQARVRGDGTPVPLRPGAPLPALRQWAFDLNGDGHTESVVAAPRRRLETFKQSYANGHNADGSDPPYRKHAMLADRLRRTPT